MSIMREQERESEEMRLKIYLVRSLKRGPSGVVSLGKSENKLVSLLEEFVTSNRGEKIEGEAVSLIIVDELEVEVGILAGLRKEFKNE